MIMFQITMQLPVIFAILAASWVQGSEASKCNQTLIGLIETFNKIEPTNILANVSRSLILKVKLVEYNDLPEP